MVVGYLGGYKDVGVAEVISLGAKKSAREEERRIFYCLACGSYSFKVVESKGEDWLACANCECWIIEFSLTRIVKDI
jgi:transcription elongation factor Elf1